MSLPEPTAPRLTRLELQGFKSFVSRTLFVFDSGITAIIGPNGSGKSNISDAVRWVLGEQSYIALRGKKSEDVIFAGGKGRAPAGMAEVTVTFDNTGRWLPIDFTEVAVTRRVFRAANGDSQNQYLINGRRVRLKDVAQLTASLGQSHTVVGQGLVDAALSQRAEERRALFEHAADLTGLRLKAAEAERNLAETEANNARLSDLLTELAPRLRTLERQARQAQDWHELRARLHALQQRSYHRQLAAALETATAAEVRAHQTRAAIAEAQRALDSLMHKEAVARETVGQARAALAAHDTTLAERREEARRLTHDRDLAIERHAALVRRREDMADTQAGLDEQAAAAGRALAALDEALRTLGLEVEQARRQVAARQQLGDAAQQARTKCERQAATLAQRLRDQERTEQDLARRQALLEQRRTTATAERERTTAAIAERAARIDGLNQEIAAFEQTAREDADQLAALDAHLAELAAAIDAAAAAADAARDAATAAERQLDQATTRLDVLQRLHESGTGLYAGVRATLQAAKAGELQGIRGTVAELIEVPAEYDTAIEVALGGHLQDVVIERWADAEAAIAQLKRANAGRATFQPLDTVRGPNRSRGLPANLLGHGGVLGVASDLVSAAPELERVIDALLGRIVVVADLPAARAALPDLPSGWSAVTLGGEIARSGGSVTGGANVRESGILARERELRQLPAKNKRLQQARDAAQTKQQAAQAEHRRLTGERQQAETDRSGQLATQRERQHQMQRLVAWRKDQEAEQAAAERQQSQHGSDADSIVAELAKLAEHQAVLAAAMAETREEQDQAQQELTRQTAATGETARDLAAERQHLAALEERLRAERRRQTDLRTQQQAVAEELTLRAERTAVLQRELAALAGEQQRLADETTAVTRDVDEATADREPLAATLVEAETRTTRLAQHVEAARAELLERERAAGGGELAWERANDALTALQQRIADELELDEVETLLEATDDDETIAPEELEREIARLKERLRRIGYIGDDVVEEYTREAERQAFLQTQLADVEGAATALRTLLTEVQVTMRSRFEATFAQVAEAFSEIFTILFGGGIARLVLAPGDDEAGVGIDIVAQPPGKRLQNLVLLSGGERALTAVALLLAILRVNPTPFCLLDEVDAALDEANVVRVREQLRELARETQVIAITHNRGTIEIADTLYGVSMGDDGISQVLSLRLEPATVS